MSNLYNFLEPKNIQYPILVSSPHSGTFFPENLRPKFKQSVLDDLDDTDWHIHQLYDFVVDMGLPLISANLHRYVIDLNRTDSSTPLYNDGRVITGLCPTTTFNGASIYKTNQTPSDADIQERLHLYYYPYYQKIQETLDHMKEKFGKVLLWDAHSIRSLVPGIRQEAFPALILGSSDEKSAPKEIWEPAMEVLLNFNAEAEHNHPFKGGNITRSFGRPEKQQFALQLEMTKLNYMDDAEKEYHPLRATATSKMLQNLFETIGKTLI